LYIKIGYFYLFLPLLLERAGMRIVKSTPYLFVFFHGEKANTYIDTDALKKGSFIKTVLPNIIKLSDLLLWSAEL